MEIECPAQGCHFKTPKMEPQVAIELLKLHNSNVHGSNSASPSLKAEPLKRPGITLEMSETSWRDFNLQWARYKRSTSLSGMNVIDQLICCCSDLLRMDVNSEYGDQLNDMKKSIYLMA